MELTRPVRTIVFLSVSLLTFLPASQASAEQPARTSGPIDIGSRLELFVDDLLIDKLNGVTKMLHPPTPQNAAIVIDKPWESPHIAYVVIVNDVNAAGKKLFRMYYRSMTNKRNTGTPSYSGYAESDDGITWRKPALGIINFKGSKENNLVFDEMQTTSLSSGGNLWPFKDENPNAKESERYKAIIPFRMRGHKPDGTPLMAVASPDGLHWKRMQQNPVDDAWALRSEKTNMTFWDSNKKKYVMYIRSWSDPGFLLGFRHVSLVESDDFLNWGPVKPIKFGDAPGEHHYWFAPQQYFRAPHQYIALSMRYLPLLATEGKLTQEGRKWPQSASRNTWDGFYAPEHGITDCVLSAGRDGLNWQRHMSAFLRPGRDGKNWTDRNLIPARGIIQTAPDELSIYWVENYMHPSLRVRRGTLRLDGFVSMHAEYSGGDFVTKPLKFTGDKLVINFASSAAGGLRAEIRDEAGHPIPGFTLAESADIYGDEIEQIVAWKKGTSVASLAGKSVRLKFTIKDADLYSIRFTP